MDSNSFTKTKNWSGRNEVTETSGRLHSLWPQNKWLQSPPTTDYRHTRQDRWIQTKLAFTHAKNVTKPNPFEIIPLQTTRKENNWKTEEAMARAAVTLETEWIKRSNPWSLLLLLLLLLFSHRSYAFQRQEGFIVFSLLLDGYLRSILYLSGEEFSSESWLSTDQTTRCQTRKE